VGQGDAAAIRTPAGRWVLVDGGPKTPRFDAGSGRVVPFLRRHGANRLSLLVLSHGDADHLGGVPAVLAALPADAVIEPGEAAPKPLYREFLSLVSRRSTSWRAARAGESLEADGVRFRIWHPDSAWLARGEKANENSVVLTVEYGRFRALFPGDAGLPMESLLAGNIGDVTLLKVGHHGSRTATGPEWLRAVRPEICLVSVGRNTYGHPSPRVLADLERAGCEYWRTDLAGDVTVETDGQQVTVRGGGRERTVRINDKGGERP
jgi:competence protein ComEC